MEINGYRIVEEINRGPVTTVFRALHSVLDRDVLLKVLNIQWNQDSEFLERFKREARISAKLNHPNIAAIYDFGTDGPFFYIAMEYVKGRTLKQLIESFNPIPLPIILYFTRQICSALSFAHQKSVVHRDIKPTNILVNDKGEIKITDFGLAKVINLPSITDQGTGLGTPAYMSPEQAMGKETSIKSDYFSLGSTLYEMCSGISPFKAESIAETITNVTRQNPKPVSSIQNTVPQWYENFLSQLMHKDPARRGTSLVPFMAQIEVEQNAINPKDMEKLLRDPKLSFTSSQGHQNVTVHSFNKVWLLILPFIIVLSFAFYYYNSLDNSDEKIPQKENLLPETDNIDLSLVSSNTDSISHQTMIPPFGNTGISEANRRESSAPMVSNHDTVRPITEETTQIESLLHIFCVPWAEVYFDGKYIDTTPLEGPVRLSPGVYLIELKNPNFQSYRHLVEVSTAVSETLNIALKSNYGYLLVQAVPWADIYLDDTYFETTPLKQPLQIGTGRHILRLLNPGYQALVDTINVKSGEMLERNYKF